MGPYKYLILELTVMGGVIHGRALPIFFTVLYRLTGIQRKSLKARTQSSYISHLLYFPFFLMSNRTYPNLPLTRD